MLHRTEPTGISFSRRAFLAAAASFPLAGSGSSVDASIRQPGQDGLIVHTTKPMNAEPHLSNLVRSYITPVEQFYVRSHAPNPRVSADTYRLSVEGMVDRPLTLSLTQLNEDFPRTEAIATMTCAGNRRSEHSLIKPVSGVPWQEGAIGNAKWGGVRLSDVLRKAGVKSGAEHVCFEGLDEIERSGGIIPFGASIPLGKAMDDSQDMPGAIVCSSMNDQPLTPDHGWPLRMTVPGYVGARSVKWLGRIVVSDRPSPNHYVATAYKVVTTGTDLEWAENGPIYRFPINSVICSPSANSVVTGGNVSVAGYALPPGQPGRTISRVDVSPDGGKTWQQAKLTSISREYCWQLWSADVRLVSSTEQLMVRATDSTMETQPERVAWNMKGYLFNGWHQVPLRVSK